VKSVQQIKIISMNEEIDNKAGSGAGA